MNSTKIHTFVDDGNHQYTPCGLGNTHCHSLPIENYHKVDVGDRCKRCNELYQMHLKSFLEVDRAYLFCSGWEKYYEHYSFVVLSCGYAHGGISEYKYLSMKVIKFDDLLNYIKQITLSPTLYGAECFKNNGIDMTKDKIEYIKKLCRVVNG